MSPQKIIEKLSEMGVSQSEMSNCSGLSQGRISQILKDGGSCSFGSGQKLFELLAQKNSLPDLSKEQESA